MGGGDACGNERGWAGCAAPESPGERAPGGTGALRSMSEALGARRRLAWLNAADLSIGTTLDVRRTAEELADFTVPELADGAAVDLLDSVLRFQEGDRVSGGGAPRLRAMAVSEVEGLNLAPDPVGELSVHTADRLGQRCLTTRRPVLVSRMTRADFAVIAPSRESSDIMRRAGVHPTWRCR